MLKKIVVKNFMCHDNFEITLNPRVNFITGQNGSGKSAIVAALMLGFGQRATVTNRGQSVKDFIKRGRHSAVLEITLTNNADFAYEYEEFGDEITVVRKITESSSTYSIKDSQGKSHPCNARTLNGLLLHFSIQPNNPLCILSQDVARTFLQKFDPRSLFSLYSQATLSKTINDSFAESKDALRKLTLKIASRKEDIENLKKEVEDAERRKQMAEKYKLLMESEELVKNELIWSKVKALEDSVKKKEQIQLEIDSERNNILHKIKNCSEDALKEKLVKLEGDLGRCQENLSKLEIEQSKENDGLDRVKEELSILKQHFKEVDQLIQRKDREIEQLQEASNKVLNVNVPEIQKQKNELQSVVAKIHELEAVRKTTEVHLNQLRDTFENNAPANERISSDIRRVTNKITESRGKMELFKKGKSLALYGEWMPHFVEELSKATNRGRFTKMPKGPIGSFLQVVDPDWAPAIENVLKGHVSTFCLNSDADLKEFLRIAEKCVPRNSIPPSSTSTFLPQVHDYSQHEVQHPRYSSFIRQLKCSDADVLNCLIDELGIEQILLVPELDSTYQLCEETHNVPKNLKYCITKEGDRVHPSPSYKFFAGRMKTKVATYLQVNPTQHLTYLERRITESQQELASLKNERITIEQSTQAVKKDIAETQKSLDSLRRQLKHLNDKKLDFESKIDIEPVSVDLYKRDMEMSVSEKEKAVQKKEEIISKIGRAEVKIEEVFKNLKIISETLRPITEEKTKILQLIDSTEKDLRDKERLGTKLRAQFHSLAEKEKSLKDEMQRIRNSMKEMTENAQQTAIKIETIRDLQVVEENLRTIKAELLGLKNFCEEDTIEIAEQEYLEKKQRLKKCTRVMARVERDAKESSKKLARDTKAIEISEQKDLLKAKALFSEVLKKRDLQGSFGLDKNNQILKMNVVRGKEKGTGKKGELSSLSGGEKSFATIAFIIAMWESMTVPFFVMDEFDVFTDVITRNTILKMLLEYASQNAAQFIFLTPHDLSRIDTNRDDVTVHRSPFGRESTNTLILYGLPSESTPVKHQKSEILKSSRASDLNCLMM